MKNNNAFHSLLWRGSERLLAQGSQLLVQILLARLLLPDDFGLIAIVSAFIAMVKVFVDSGLGGALIQRTYCTRRDFCSVFYFSLLVGVVGYGVIFAIAPFVADFYDNEALCWLLRVLSLNLFFGALASVPSAIITRKLAFKKFFVIGATANLIAGATGVVAAWNGLGVWSLVIQQLVYGAYSTLLVFFIARWRPLLSFSFRSLRKMLGFSINTIFQNLLNVVFENLYSLLIGKRYSSADLGFFSRGKVFPNLLSVSLVGPLRDVLFPLLSSLKDEKEKFLAGIRNSNRVSAFLLTPALLGLAVVANDFVAIVLREQWLPCVPFLRWFCIAYVVYPFQNVINQGLMSSGKIHILSRVELVRKSLLLIFALASLPWGVQAMVFAFCLHSWLLAGMMIWVANRYLHYTPGQVCRDLCSCWGAAVLAVLAAALPALLLRNAYLLLPLQVVVGAAVYIGVSRAMRLEAFFYCRQKLFAVWSSVTGR